MINKRGGPLNKKVIHMAYTRKKFGMPPDLYVICRNGAFHIHFTKNWDEVTCEKCKEYKP